MKPISHLRSPIFASAVAVLCLLSSVLWLTGCQSNSGIQRVPIISDLVPDLTDPAELHDAAELAGLLVLQNNPDDVADLQDAVMRAERALAGESVISREMFNAWVNDLLERSIDDLVLRAFVRQRFDKAWAANGDLLNISGLLLQNPKHRELAQAFIAGLKSAADQFAEAQAEARALAGATPAQG